MRLLLDARFRTRDEGRSYVLLSLAEAETLRRVLHARLQAQMPHITYTLSLKQMIHRGGIMYICYPFRPFIYNMT